LCVCVCMCLCVCVCVCVCVCIIVCINQHFVTPYGKDWGLKVVSGLGVGFKV